MKVLIGLVLALTLAACANPAPVPGDAASQTRLVAVEGGSFTLASVDAYAAMLEAGEPAVVVNVHIPLEAELPGTDLHLAYDEIASHLDQLPADRDARVAIYCRSGRMSAEAAATLVSLGYTNVWDLDGGMVAWEADGRPLLGR
jgi:rhodanese-related sulfurtransferase